MEHVVLRNTFYIFDYFVRFRMFIALQEVENQVKPEEELYNIVEYYNDRVLCSLKSCIVHRGYA